MHTISTKRCTSLRVLTVAITMGLSAQVLAQSAVDRLSTDPQDQRLLDAVTVVGKAVRGEELKHKDNVASKTRLPIAETPQAVAVITREQMDAQAVSRVSESLRYSAGVMPESDGVDSRFESWAVRGFYSGATAWLDGIRLDGGSGAGNNWTQPQTEQFFLERIDVLKGPSSVGYGQIVPGGAVMLSSKRPQFSNAGEVQLRLRARAGGELAADFQGANQQRDAAWRLAGLGSKQQTEVDGVERGRLAVAPSVRLRFGSDGELTLLGQFQRDRGGAITSGSRPTGPCCPIPTGRSAPAHSWVIMHMTISSAIR